MAADRKLTIKDIAAELGVSHSTVSRALADSPLIGAATRQRIREAAARQGYIANSAAPTTRGAASGLIGLLVPDVQTDFFSSLVKHFSTSCSDAGLNLLLSVSRHDPVIEERLIHTLREARVAGIAIFPTKHLTPGSQALLDGIRTVQVGRRHAALRAPFVASADADSMDELVRHLLRIGHRRIGYVGSDPSILPGRPRWLAYRRAVAAAGPLAPGLRQIAWPNPDGGRLAMQRLLAQTVRPTAILVASAPMMRGAIEAAQDAGLAAPRDFSLAGFGDPDWFAIWAPGITTVALPTSGIAQAALEALLHEPGAAPDEQLLVNRLMLRGTTAPP